MVCIRSNDGRENPHTHWDKETSSQAFQETPNGSYLSSETIDGEGLHYTTSSAEECQEPSQAGLPGAGNGWAP